jgi:TPR repeat protein
MVRLRAEEVVGMPLVAALVTLATVAGNTVVTVAVTDAWESAREGFARLLGRGDPARTKLAEKRLAETHDQLIQATGADLEQTRAALEAQWVTRMADLLEDDPGVEADLRTLVQQIQAQLPAGTVSAADHAVAAGRDVNISADRGGIAVGAIQGNVVWYEKAAQAGKPVAMYNLGVLLQSSEPEAARAWFQKAAQAGHAGAMNKLGILLQGSDPRAARVWIEKAAEAGDADAMTSLGALLQSSEPDAARVWLEQAQQRARKEAERSAASPQPRPGSQPVNYDDLVRSAFAELVQPGRLLFNPPDRMQLGQTERVEVRLTRTLELDAELLDHLGGSGDPQVEEIPTAPLMVVILKGEGFRITAYSDEEQSVTQDEITTWEFDIQALKRGQQRLVMCVSLRIPVPDHPSEHKSIPVREATIDVQVGAPTLVAHFVATNWQWFIGTAIAIVAVVVAVLYH